MIIEPGMAAAGTSSSPSSREREAAGSRKVLITGGRAPAALELARLIAAAGWQVYAAESAAHHLCRVSRAVTRSFAVPSPAKDVAGFVAALADIVQREGIELLIPTCEEIFYVSAGLERLGRLCQVFAPPLQQLRMLHSKWEFIRRAEELGLTVPATRLIRSPQEWAEVAAAGTATKVKAMAKDSGTTAKAMETLAVEEAAMEAAVAADAETGRAASFEGGYVLKPEFSRFASKVRFMNKDTKTKRKPMLKLKSKSKSKSNPLLDGLPEAEFSWVAQQFVRGRSICTYSVVQDGQLAAHAAYETKYSAGGGACIYFEPLFHQQVLDWVRRFVQMERFTGQIAFDFIETEEGQVYAIECNPRATSGIHLFRPEDGLAQAFMQSGMSDGSDVYDRFESAKPDKVAKDFIEPQPGIRRMLSLPMLAYGMSGIRSWRELLQRVKQYAAAQDAVFRWNDPRPCFEQLLMLRELWKIASSKRITLMEASTLDIEWNGEPL
ncbi:hypothetical protein [Paenibacillus eucommiae]|uniref:NAD(P)-dependent dehydrogenase (Short-subunit alcohol dehydrogenase family) n=1 Tax=Paenibacillus eucommiae TaxID=1355755 RepID=A0ABS4J099_9BACL|nr:hypothetical protein [Paenibacillus eucommiae]MBP1993225.1 NAD(P)-dependent dehydrogenase (short-subunit alcohol dehydrogenase family) [Paenibacillus eucommiae]